MEKKLDINNMNGITGEEDKTCGLNDMNCLEGKEDKTCGLNDMNCVEEEEDKTCGLNYRVKIHFSTTSKETMSDKIKRLIMNDCGKIS